MNRRIKVSLIVILVFVLSYLTYPIFKANNSQAPAQSIHKLISSEEAVNIVKARPEVIKHEKDFYDFNKDHPENIIHYTPEDMGSNWTVHIYYISKGDDLTHTVTWAWYEVDKGTGKVTVD